MSIFNNPELTTKLTRYQFEKGLKHEDFDKESFQIISLEKYCEIMQAFPYLVNPKCYTLWIPFDSGNRTAHINLNHEVCGFDDDGFLIGRNGNCGMPYIIIIVPKTVTTPIKLDETFIKEKGHEKLLLNDI